ncbi:MAG: DUF4434 domain-containing protein, partial [bacterium]|nr:DUF4434 domain-containing protein [bacterium]
MRHVVMMALPVLSFGMSGSADAGVSLTLVPPGVITEQVTLDVRGAVRNDTDEARTFDVAFYLDEESEEEALHRERVEVPGRSARGVSFRWPSTGHAGGHRVIVVATCDDEVWRMDRPIQVLASDVRSTGKLNGAWVDIYHHDEAEAVPFNEELSKMTDTQWRELVRAMNRVDQNILVMTMMFQNFTHVGKHAIETEGYHGKAYYPSKRYPGRMPIAAEDPLEAILDEADRLGMYVFPGVGMYAFFDFTPASLEWHKAVADELWERYGHHDSFYGWYVSEEIAGNLGRNDARREELVAFFKAFGDHVRRLAPDKPVMLATN